MTGLTITNAVRKKALLSHYAGEDVDDIIDTLTIPAPADGQDEYTVLCDALNAHFLAQINITHIV